MLASVIAGGYALAVMNRICHTHCSKTFKASEMDFISMLPLGMALGRYAKAQHPEPYFNGQIHIYWSNHTFGLICGAYYAAQGSAYASYMPEHHVSARVPPYSPAHLQAIRALSGLKMLYFNHHIQFISWIYTYLHEQCKCDANSNLDRPPDQHYKDTRA